MAHQLPNSSLRRQWLLFALLALLLYGIIPQLQGFQKSFHLLGQADRGFILAALLTACASYFAAAATYRLLALRPIKYWPTLLVQTASMFVNRLLPGGLGALGVNYVYLKRQRHSTAAASTVVTLNNLLGVLGHSLLLIAGLLVLGHKLPPLRWHVSARVWLMVAVATVLGVAVIVLYNPLRRRLRRLVVAIAAELHHYQERPLKIVGALGTSMCLTLTYTMTLWFCTRAVGIDLSLIAIFLVLSLGVGLGTATPTPGGLGGMEAGLVAGLIGFQVPASTALAAVLLFRLLTYWLALLLGAVAFAVARQQKLL